MEKEWFEEVKSLVLDMRVEMKEMRQEIQEVRAELKQEIQEVRAELKQEIQEVRTEMRQEIQSVSTEMRQEIQSVSTEMRQGFRDQDAKIDQLRAEMKQDFKLLGDYCERIEKLAAGHDHQIRITARHQRAMEMDLELTIDRVDKLELALQP
ncbi:MAG: hypothetical protein J7639_21550 [Paenibacillaceae bacterium]|nr:hypothetical protein [Paenibacillaceae bacterium]